MYNYIILLVMHNDKIYDKKTSEQKQTYQKTPYKVNKNT